MAGSRDRGAVALGSATSEAIAQGADGDGIVVVDDPAIHDAFISYSHASDGVLAAQLQRGLERFAKPAWKPRAMRVFRDRTDLHANPHVWATLVEQLERSKHLVVLLSPDAAASPWVNQEVKFWLERGRADRLLLVLTEGTLDWDDVTGRFRPEMSTALPAALSDACESEPLWVDMRWTDDQSHLDLRNTRFRDDIATLAAAIWNRPKRELEDIEAREVAKLRRLRRLAVGIIAALLLAVAAAGAFAVVQYVALERANGDLETVRAEVASTGRELEQRQTELRAAQDEVATKQAEVRAAQAAVELARGELTSAQQRLGSTEAELEDRRQDVEARQRDLVAKQGELDELQQQLSVKQAELTAKQAELTAKQAELTAKQAELTSRRPISTSRRPLSTAPVQSLP